MTPSEAAALLGVADGAGVAEIEAAYRRKAATTHPDRFAGADPHQLSSASREFVRVTDARGVLLSQIAARAGGNGAEAEIPITPPYEGYETRSVAPHNWIAFTIWAFFLGGGLVVSSFDFTAPSSIWDILFRLVPIGVCSVAFALTGRRGWLIAMAVLALASIVITFAIASFGPLIAIEALLIPMLGMAYLGRSRRLFVASKRIA